MRYSVLILTALLSAWSYGGILSLIGGYTVEQLLIRIALFGLVLAVALGAAFHPLSVTFEAKWISKRRLAKEIERIGFRAPADGVETFRPTWRTGLLNSPMTVRRLDHLYEVTGPYWHVRRLERRIRE